MFKKILFATIIASSFSAAHATDRYYSYAYGPAENGYINSANNPEFYRSDNYAERRQRGFDTRRHAAPGSRAPLYTQTGPGTPSFDYEHAGTGPCISEWSCD